MFATAVLLSAVCISLTAGQVDQTLTPEASGDAVVKAVVSRIRQSGIFPDDRSLLRRIAFVESKDGADQGTYRAGYHGGIWQVDQIGFQDTQNTASHPGLIAKHQKIQDNFGIDWSRVTWMDLRKPLYSGIAARLFLSNIPEAIPPASEIKMQGDYWKDHYNSDADNAAGTVQKFVNDVQALEAQTECRSGIDLIFVLDASGSIGSANFQLMRNFFANVVRNLNIGPDQTRVGVIVYSYSASVQFSLNRYMTNVSLLQAIATIPYTGGGTNTADAILTCIQQFSTLYGARPRSSGIPRIAIVVTDGRSNNKASTIAAAQMAHSANILSYAVGVGSNVDMTELAAIASDPDSQYVHSLSSFSISGLRSLQETLNEEACTAPAISDVGQAITSTLEQNEAAYIQLDLPEDGMTFRLDVSQGSVVMYGSNKIQNPNEAFYDFKLSNNQPEIFVTDKTFLSSITKRQILTNNTDEITIYIKIEGQSVSNNFTLNTTIGDTTEPTTVPSTEPTTVPSTETTATLTTSIFTNTPQPNILPIAVGVAVGLVILIPVMIVVIIIVLSAVVCAAHKKVLV